MKIQQINQQYNNRKNKPNFTGPIDTAFRFLDINQAWGATAVDFTCMVAPRTLTDFTRGADAGVETLRREASGTVNHALVGVYGTLAGMLAASAVNAKYGIGAHKMFAGPETIDVLSKQWHNAIHSGENDLISAYSNKVTNIIRVGGEPLSDDAKAAFSKTFAQEIKGGKKGLKEVLKSTVLDDKALSEIGLFTGKYTEKGEEIIIKNSLENAIDNYSSVSKILNKEKVIESFKKAIKFEDVNFTKALKSMAVKRSILGLGIASAIGCCIQPLNIYLTKKKTGSDGFVGVEGREKDKTFGFKTLKALTAGAFGVGVYGLISKFKAKDFLKNIQYKGMTPTLPQFMLVYGVTIMSRFIAARDKDELREAAIKDTLGYLNWLVLGNFVARGALKMMDKTLKGKTRDEILHTALKKAGLKSVEDGKALSFNKMLKSMKEAAVHNDTVGTILKTTKSQLRKFNIAQFAGYAYSALILGVGIPKLNIYMTKKSEQKRAMQRAINPSNMMLKPENIAFLSNQMSFTSNKILGE